MADTNALLAFGGMTQHCRRWGWRMFFLAPAQSSSHWRDRQFAVRQPFSPTAARSSARVPWEVWNKPAQSIWLLSRRQKSVQPPCRPLLAAQHSLEAFFHQLLPDPVNHRCAGLQRLDNPIVTPAFTGFRHIGLQQYPRFQQSLRRTLAFAYQRFEFLTFLTAQPHNILLYRNLLRSHDCLRRIRCDQSESQNSRPCKLIEASDQRRAWPSTSGSVL